MNEFLPMTEDEQLMFSTTPIKGNNQILGTGFFTTMRTRGNII